MMHMFGGGNIWIPISVGLHMFFMSVFTLGVVFLLIWAIKSMDKNQLKKWTKGLLIVGIIGCLLTSATCFYGLRQGLKDGTFDPEKAFGYGKYGKCATAEVADELPSPVPTIE